MPMDTINNFAFLGLGVWSDGETWTRRGGSGFGGWRARGSGVDGFRVSREGRWIHERNGGLAELCLSGDDLDGVVEDVVGGHGVKAW